MWSLEFLKKTSFNWGLWFRGWKKIMAISRAEQRTQISKAALDYIKQVEGRLWY
jgi:hypothetical protein